MHTSATQGNSQHISCLSQGHLHTRLGGAGDRTCNLPVTSKPAPPPEPHAATSVSLRVFQVLILFLWPPGVLFRGPGPLAGGPTGGDGLHHRPGCPPLRLHRRGDHRQRHPAGQAVLLVSPPRTTSHHTDGPDLKTLQVHENECSITHVNTRGGTKYRYRGISCPFFVRYENRYTGTK